MQAEEIIDGIPPSIESLSGEQLKSRFSHIWTMDKPVNAKLVLLPQTTDELASILSFCNQHKQTIVVHGGLTNLVGATRTNPDDVVISLEKMNKITEFDIQSKTITVEAGVILENIHQHLANTGLMFPLNFGAKGSAQIGGILSSNAGGLRVFRYGVTRQLVLGLEVVTADGKILSSMKALQKDNTGYDLKQLFIGAEGTLGIITKAILKLVPQPESRVSAFIALNDYNNVLESLTQLQQNLSGRLTGYELIWGETYKVMTSPPAVPKPPLPHGHNYYVLMEVMGNDQDKEFNDLQGQLESLMISDRIEDAAITQSQSDLDWFWRIREDVHLLAKHCPFDQHFDISLPPVKIGSYVDSTVEELLKLEGVQKVFTFGHIADGNIHFIVGKSSADDDLRLQINDAIYRPLAKLNGSVSAEHGIGLDKKAYLKYSRSDIEIEIMRQIKQILDPNWILNRGRIFDE